MELQKKWYDYGNELTGAFSELANFEKSLKPELEKKIREYDDLDDRAEKLAGKLTAETVDLNTRKVAIFAGMREAATKIRGGGMAFSQVAPAAAQWPSAAALFIDVKNVIW